MNNNINETNALFDMEDNLYTRESEPFILQSARLRELYNKEREKTKKIYRIFTVILIIIAVVLLFFLPGGK